MEEVITNNREKCNWALEALQQVNDPEIGLNIVDLGLVYQVDFDESDQKIYLQMTLTTQFCPMGNSILEAAGLALEQAFPGYEVEVSLTFEPHWNSERISTQGKIFLNR